MSFDGSQEAMFYLHIWNKLHKQTNAQYKAMVLFEKLIEVFQSSVLPHSQSSAAACEWTNVDTLW